MTIRIISFLAIAGLFFTGCTEERTHCVEGSILAVMENGKTRTAVTDEGNFTWSAGDKIWIQTTGGGITGTLSSGAGTANADFSYEAYFGELTGKAIYPYNNGHYISGDKLIITLPSSYDLGDNLSNTNTVMYGEFTGGAIRFNHLGGVMRFAFKNVPAGTDSFKITLDKKANGAFTADLTEVQPTIKAESTNLDSERTVTLNFNPLAKETDIDLYIPLPIGTYTTLELGLYADEEAIWRYSNTAANTISRKTLKLMPAVDVTDMSSIMADYQWYIYAVGDNYYIQNVNELLGLSKLANGDEDALSITGENSAVSFEGKNIHLTNDIDLGPYCNEGNGNSWVPIANFMGNFKGHGYSIKNLYCDKEGNMGLFNQLQNASISDLKIAGKIQRVSQDMVSQSNIGGLAAIARDSKFENCTSDVLIETSSNSNTCPITQITGGMIGTAYDCQFIACHYISSIKDYQGEWEYTHYIGGIIGYSNRSKLVACTSANGSITQDRKQAYCYVGGIVGFISDSDKTTMQSCYSSVNVEGRQPGQILGGCGQAYGQPNIKSSYYSGPSSYKGVGTKYYGGHENSYDFGTARSTDLKSEIDEMNANIDQWNNENPEYICNYKYVLRNGNQLNLIEI